jgi:YVTN family beta-propeller protein
MKQSYLLIILAIPTSFISGVGLTMFMSSSHTSNEPPNHVVVANQIDNNTFISQDDNGTVFAAVNPTTNRIYVATEHHMVNNVEQNGTVTVIDGNNNYTKIASIPVGVKPLGIAVNYVTNRIYVTNYMDGTVSVIDGNSNKVIGKPIKLDFGVEGIAINPLTNKIYVANGVTATVYVIDGGDTGSKVDEIRRLSAWNVAVNSVTNKIYVPSYFFNNLSVIDGKYDNVMTVIPIGRYPN